MSLHNLKIVYKWVLSVFTVVVAITISYIIFADSPATLRSHAAAAPQSGMITGIGGKCIDIKYNQRYNGNSVQLYTCLNNAAQQWTFDADGTIRSEGYCLDVQGVGTVAGTPVWLWSCYGGPAQIWQPQKDGTLKNPNSGMCLDDHNADIADGNQLWIWPCDGNIAQRWAVSNSLDSVNWGAVTAPPPGGWRRLTRVRDGSWLEVTTAFISSTRSQLNVYRSTDGGHTWTYLSGVNDGERLVDNGNIYEAPNGDILLSARNNVLNSSYRISQWRSPDRGLTWFREPDIAAGGRGLWEPFYFTANGGRTVIMWADEGISGYSQVIQERSSGDSGRTWAPPAIVASDGINGRPGMPVVTRMANGQYMMVIEVCGTHNCNVFQKISADGMGWPGGIGFQIPGVVCGPFITALTNGRILVTGCRTSDTNYTTPIMTSGDYGATWQPSAPAFTNGDKFGGWPALYQLNPGEVLAVGGADRLGTFPFANIQTISLPTNTPAQIPATLTPTPTQLPVTPTPTLPLNPTATASPTPVTKNATTIGLSLLLHGLGNGGEGSSRSAVGNFKLNHPQRQVTIEIYNASNNLVATQSGIVQFDTAKGTFTGTLTVTDSIQSGAYTIRVKSPQFLRAQIPGIVILTAGTLNQLKPASLTNGDINDDNVTNIMDYNILMGCYSDLSAPANCPGGYETKADINDDGAVNQFDYNFYLRESSIITGQ